jgi:REP element-mobilizing transposase RayT
VAGNARRDIVREGEIGTYHCWSRCVQRAFLCGYDEVTGIDFDYRRAWLEELLEYQAGVFAVDVGSYSILSNHIHAVLRTRPDIAAAWSAEEVAIRWKKAWPRFDGSCWSRDPTEEEVLELLVQPDKIATIRENLSSLSWLMARWKEPISRLCNTEMETSGHFWEARFGSRELIDEAAVLTCSMYVDLNQVKAGQAPSLVDSQHSSIRKRILAAQHREAEESREAFQHEKRSEKFPFPVSAAERLFEDCWLSPIDQEGPLITGEAIRLSEEASQETCSPNPAIDPELEPAEPTKRESRNSVEEVHRTTTEVSSDEPVGQATKGRGCESAGCQSAPSHPAHRRASDSPYIGVPWSEYLRVLEGLVAMMAAGGTMPEHTDAGSQVFRELAETLLNWGMKPKAWAASLDDLNRKCHHILGSADQVEARATQNGKRCYFGINLCRNILGKPNLNESGFT